MFLPSRVRHGGRALSAVVLLASVTAWAPLAAQTTVATTLGPGGSFGTGSYYTIGNDSPTTNYDRRVATSFTYGGPAGFELFDLGLGLQNAIAPLLPAFYNIEFRRGATFTTSSYLDGWAFATTTTSPANELRRFDFGSAIELVTGETYWIHVFGFDGYMSGWARNDQGLTSASGNLLRRDTENNPEWTEWDNLLPAYEVRATGQSVSVPEPAMAALLLLGVVPMALRRRKRTTI
jgi:hypothetical protein